MAQIVSKTTNLTSAVSIPDSYDMRSVISNITQFPVFNQGNLGSCTANAAAGALLFCQLRDKWPTVSLLSRLYIYYMERYNDQSGGGPAYDSGATIPDAITAIMKGVPAESDWPYTDQTTTDFLPAPFDKFTTVPFTQQPSAKNLIIFDTDSLSNLTHLNFTGQSSTILKAALKSNHPLLINFTVYSSFEDTSRVTSPAGVMPIPNTSTESCLGGHAIMLVGYKESMPYTTTVTTMNARTGKPTSTKTTGSDNFFIARNSWGSGWGDGGYFYMPYSLITNISLTPSIYVVTTVGTKAAS